MADAAHTVESSLPGSELLSGMNSEENRAIAKDATRPPAAPASRPFQPWGLCLFMSCPRDRGHPHCGRDFRDLTDEARSDATHSELLHIPRARCREGLTQIGAPIEAKDAVGERFG